MRGPVRGDKHEEGPQLIGLEVLALIFELCLALWAKRRFYAPKGLPATTSDRAQSAK